jgi:adenylate cyclase
LSAITLVWSGCTVSRILIESSERERIRKKFGHYVDRKLVDHVLEQRTDLGPQTREMTVVFTDLQGFTELSEKLGERTVPLLNDFLGLMVPVIRDKHQGYVNKFLGDGIMFFFGAPIENPNHARDAVATVLDMRDAMQPFNAKLREQGLPPLVMRAGISTGKMVVGDAGSSDQADYTVLGDVVNLGARLESANKSLGTELLISGRTAEMLNGQFLLRPVGNVRVVGKNEAVQTFEVIGRAPDGTDAHNKLIELTRCIVDAFRGRDFAGCLKMLDDIETAQGPTKLTQLYRELCTRYLAQPPADGFAGEVSLNEK